MPRNLTKSATFDWEHRHEQGKNFHNVVQPRIRDAIVVFKGPNKCLRDDSANLTGRCTNTEGRRTIPSGEDFTGNKESRRIGTKVLEEIAKTVECK